MGKNLKDIVDEGFSQLAVLAEKRKEILVRVERISTAVSGPQGAEAELKVKEAESLFLSEMNQRVEKLLQELRQTLAQVSDNNAVFHESLKDSLRQHVFGILTELGITKSYVMTGATERLDVLLLELDKKFQADQRTVGTEASRLFAELENAGQSNQSALRQSLSETVAKLSVSETDTSAMLGKAFNQIVVDAEKKRHEVSEFLNTLYKRQVEKLEAGSSEMNLRVAPLVKEQCDSMRDSCIATEKSLTEMHDTTITSAVDELKKVSKEPLAELERQNEDARENLSEKLNELRDVGTRLLKQEKRSFVERNDGVASGADEIYLLMSKFDSGANGTVRNKVDDAFAEIGSELNGLTDDLGGKLRDMLKAQSDGLARLSASTDKGFTDLFLDFKTQLNELVNAQEQLCTQKEDELFLQLQKLEEQIGETYSLLRSSGYTGKKEGNGSAGGVKE